MKRKKNVLRVSFMEKARKKERKKVCFQVLKKNKDGFIMVLETNPKSKETNLPFLLAFMVLETNPKNKETTPPPSFC
jgi:hypothetical protein